MEEISPAPQEHEFPIAHLEIEPYEKEDMADLFIDGEHTIRLRGDALALADLFIRNRNQQLTKDDIYTLLKLRKDRSGEEDLKYWENASARARRRIAEALPIISLGPRRNCFVLEDNSSTNYELRAVEIEPAQPQLTQKQLGYAALKLTEEEAPSPTIPLGEYDIYTRGVLTRNNIPLAVVSGDVYAIGRLFIENKGIPITNEDMRKVLSLRKSPRNLDKNSLDDFASHSRASLRKFIELSFWGSRNNGIHAFIGEGVDYEIKPFVKSAKTVQNQQASSSQAEKVPTLTTKGSQAYYVLNSDFESEQSEEIEPELNPQVVEEVVTEPELIEEVKLKPEVEHTQPTSDVAPPKKRVFSKAEQFAAQQRLSARRLNNPKNKRKSRTR